MFNSRSQNLKKYSTNSLWLHLSVEIKCDLIEGGLLMFFSLKFNITFMTIAHSLTFIQQNDYHSMKAPCFAHKILKNEGGLTVQIFEKIAFERTTSEI